MGKRKLYTKAESDFLDRALARKAEAEAREVKAHGGLSKEARAAIRAIAVLRERQRERKKKERGVLFKQTAEAFRRPPLPDLLLGRMDPGKWYEQSAAKVLVPECSNPTRLAWQAWHDGFLVRALNPAAEGLSRVCLPDLYLYRLSTAGEAVCAMQKPRLIERGLLYPVR